VTRVIYFLYRLSLGLVSPLILIYFLVRSLRTKGYGATMPERFGSLPPSFQQTGSASIWLHAVSVGEVLASVELIRQLRVELPGSPVFVSVSTLAGRTMADQKLKDLVHGIFYAPLEYVWIVRRVLRRIRPAVVVVLETEIWPNLFRESKRAGSGLVIVNARISDRAESRYARLRWFFRHVLLWPDTILAQSGPMRDRYVGAGAPAATVTVSGNLKYDVAPVPPSPAVAAFLKRIGPARVWIAASTMPPDEEQTVIEAFRQVSQTVPGLLLLLAPRKPERFDETAGLLRDAGIPFVRRSSLGADARLELPAYRTSCSSAEAS
jgi:3-deoxy-D-manno-octulosonic-acid transferase